MFVIFYLARQENISPLKCLKFKLTFFFNDTATTEIYTLSLHDALPIWLLTALRRLKNVNEIGKMEQEKILKLK